jgi:hypothetical protein
LSKVSKRNMSRFANLVSNLKPRWDFAERDTEELSTGFEF